MENGTPVIIEGKEYRKGTQVSIAGKLWQVINTMPGLKQVCFARVNKNGKLAKMNNRTVGSHSFDDIAKFMKLGSII